MDIRDSSSRNQEFGDLLLMETTGKLTCLGLPVTILGTPGDDFILGTAGDDVIHGFGGNDILRGLGGDDYICGGDGDDELIGNWGNDMMAGGTGNDGMYGVQGRDVMYGNSGSDTIFGGGENDIVYGGFGDDIINGGTGDDRLFGGPDDDILFGGLDDDILDGSDGLDDLNGGEGTDTCRNGVTFEMCEPTTTDTRPNIVVIYTDDQHWNTLDYLPNVMHRLAAEGIEFTNSFVTTSLCCPSRASFLSGQYTHNHGVWENIPPNGGVESFNDTSTLATSLKDAGYSTSFVGKYLNGYWRIPDYIPPGWDDWNVFVEAGFYNYKLNENGIFKDYGFGVSDYSTDVFKDLAVNFIQSADSPFFLMMSPLAPHTDVFLGRPIPAPRHEGTCDGLPLHRPPSYNEDDISDKPSFIKRIPLWDEMRTDLVDKFREDQICTLKAVDDAIASILDALGPELDNTVIIFTSDNGYLWGEHRLEKKWRFYDEASRVPLVIRYPKLIPENVTNNDLVLNIDIAPTIAELAGASLTIPVNGNSLVSLLNGEDWRDDFLMEQNRNGEQAGVRTLQFKYVEHIMVGGNEGRNEFEFYDLLVDPYELNNEINNPVYSEIIDNLAQRLEELKLE